MAGPKAEKVAIVEEVKQRFADADAVLVTEYRGINVGEMATLRRALRDAGGEYKIYKNSLVRRAVDGQSEEFNALLTGPTALAFVVGSDDKPADPAAVAKALKEFGKTNDHLVVKGGLLGDALLGVDEAKALADLPSRDQLLSQFAGVLQAPLTKTARLLNAVPQKLAYGLSALIEAGGAEGAPAGEAPADEEAPAPEAPTAEAPADDANGDDAVAEDDSSTAPSADDAPETTEATATEES